MARLAREHDVDLVLVDAPDGLLEDGRVLALLDQAPCDVGVVVGDGRPCAGPRPRAVRGCRARLGRRRARRVARARPRRDSSARWGDDVGADGRDASRLLANASLAVQRALGVAAEPVLVEPDPAALVDAARGAGAVVVGLTDRWRREGLGRTRTALATRRTTPAVLVRRGVRPGGLAPRGERDALHLDDRGLTGFVLAPSRGRGPLARLRAGTGRRHLGEQPPKLCVDVWHDPDRLERRLAAVVDDPREVAVAHRLPVPVEPDPPAGA